MCPSLANQKLLTPWPVKTFPAEIQETLGWSSGEKANKG